MMLNVVGERIKGFVWKVPTASLSIDMKLPKDVLGATYRESDKNPVRLGQKGVGFGVGRV